MQNRAPKGTPVGGRYATTQKQEADVLPFMLCDAEGFPAVACNSCAGKGMISGGRCYGCSGTGIVPADQRTRKAIAEYERARRVASRPKADDIEVGQVVAPVSKTPGRAEWGVVTRIRRSTKPVAYTVVGGERVPSAWALRIEMEDGRDLVVSSDAVVQRRSDGVVDVEPFIAKARGDQ